jgi:hypothetical protein
VRRVALLSIAAVAVLANASCAGGEGPRVEVCASGPTVALDKPTGAPSEPLLGMLALPNTGVILARLDPRSLKPVSRRLEVGEYHDAWSLSPDRSQLALGMSSGGSVISPSRRLRARIGVMIVDLEAMKVVQEVETGIAAEALGWLTPRLLVAGLLEPLVSGAGAPSQGGTVVVDPLTGKILRRWPRLSFPQASARTRDSFVMLLPGLPPDTAEGTAAPRLAVVDARGRLWSVALERIQLALRDGVQWDGAGLAVDAGQARAYVFAADAPVAEIDLRTMRVSYHRLEALFRRPGELGDAEVQSDGKLSWRSRRTLWLGDGHVLVFGQDGFAAAGVQDFQAIAAGAILVDTATWSSCVLDTSAGGTAFVAERVLVYGRGDPARRGLRAYTVEGREAFHLFDGEQVWDIQVAAQLAYVSTRSAVHVVDVKSGKVVSEIVPPVELVDVIPGSS